MEFQEMKNEFVSKYDYLAEMRNFENYLNYLTHGAITLVTLQGIRTENIIESIKYNIQHNQHASKSIALKYASAVAQFFRYADSQQWFRNDNFRDEINAPFRFSGDSYRARITEFISSNRKLLEKESKDVLTREEVQRILDFVDSYLSEVNFNEHAVEYDVAAAMLAIKLMIFSGIKYKAAKDLLVSSVSMPTNQITINGYCLRMPVNFTSQIVRYMEIRPQVDCQNLFLSGNGYAWAEKTPSSKIPDVLKKILGRRDTTGLTKYGIREWLNVGTGITEIETLTGAKADLIRGCMADIDESAQDKANNYMNMQMSQTEIYYKC